MHKQEDTIWQQGLINPAIYHPSVKVMEEIRKINSMWVEELICPNTSKDKFIHKNSFHEFQRGFSFYFQQIVELVELGLSISRNEIDIYMSFGGKLKIQATYLGLEAAINHAVAKDGNRFYISKGLISVGDEWSLSIENEIETFSIKKDNKSILERGTMEIKQIGLDKYGNPKTLEIETTIVTAYAIGTLVNKQNTVLYRKVVIIPKKEFQARRLASKAFEFKKWQTIMSEKSAVRFLIDKYLLPTFLPQRDFLNESDDRYQPQEEESFIQEPTQQNVEPVVLAKESDVEELKSSMRTYAELLVEKEEEVNKKIEEFTLSALTRFKVNALEDISSPDIKKYLDTIAKAIEKKVKKNV